MTVSNEGPASMAGPTSETQQSTTTNGASYALPAIKKLHGRAFYKSIGSPKFILAPMVDQSEFAWRMLSRSFMPSSSPRDLLAYTPMLHARMFTETPKFRDAHFQPLRTSLTSHPSPTTPPSPADFYLDGNPTIDRPLFAQFCANNPPELLNAARYVAPFVDAVDLNLGCPQGIARKGHYGAFLQEDQELIYSLINKLHNELEIPVTAKIRILETREKTLEYARNVVKAGVSILTVHGRTREMKGHKTGLADWSVIRFLREQLPKETVLFANGNILRKEDISRCLEETGADGVMSAEGNLYDPAIFADPPAVGEEGREFWRGRDGKGGWRMDAVFRRYMDILYKYVLEQPAPERKPLYLPSDPELPPPVVENGVGKRKAEDEEEDGPPKKKRKRGGERTSNPNLLAMQPHLFHLLRPLVSRHHNVRDALARCRAGDIAAFENVLQLVEIAVKEGLKEYEESNGKSWEEEMERDERLKAAKEAEEKLKGGEKKEESEKEEMDESSVETVRACKRPWWVVQPYVRPLPKEALAKGSLTLSKKERAALEAGAVAVKGESNVVKESGVPNGHVEVEKVGEGREEIEIPKVGLACG
ncbi:putative dihydrouridine synthase family protein [Hyaloscypha hepaticicola]|uniref:tRNA-dihydrouridine(16/17) synthase [NAD(P)(+)] n=1 Tax=Hyaloscypha hepaticicola TaxID=2082293 RepID=A0A2J6QDH6_9HELO|nr:putative dihydrouridine synthase family protein [Hyaloscypha hepaticicola]